MFRKLAVGGISVLLLASPLVSSADVLSDLQAQIQALFAQLRSLEAQTGVSTSPVVDPAGPTDDYGTGVQPGSSCPTLSITMQRGSRDTTTGGQVTELQVFLADHFNLNEEDVVSGYFGKVTESYVIKFQNEQGLPNFGIAGSLTRAKIAQVCGAIVPPPPQPGTLSASPASGPAPLDVTFFHRVTGQGGSTTIDFGDGTSAQARTCYAPSDVCLNSGTNTHVYSSAGTYTARLYRGGQTFGTVTITVSGTNDATLSASPIFGSAPLTVYFQGRGSMLAESAGISFGDGTQSGERSLNVYHVYQNPGTYTALLHKDGAKGEVVATATVTVSGGAGKCGINSYSVDNMCDANSSSYRSMYVKCQDGYEERQGVESSCKPAGVWHSYAEQVCANRCSGTPSGITVTVPNGGEQWEIGQLNTITWSPYGYNPDANPAKDVTVELVKKMTTCATGLPCDWFSTIGKIMDTGKASLHTYFNIDSYDKWAEPGQYYVRVYNKVTDKQDYSDAPFTLLPRGVDIKVDGSDGPVTLSDNQAVTITYKVGTTFPSCMLNGVRSAPNATPGVSVANVVQGGTYNGYAYAPTPGSSTAIYMTCTKADGSARSDSVQVNISGTAASLKIVSPNGGERRDISKPFDYTVAFSGVKSQSVALYKNDMFKMWIFRDNTVHPENSPQTFSFIPLQHEGLSTADATGESVWKLYVTAQKADGTGYVDDKSDAPFSFVPQFVPTGPSCSLTSNKTSYAFGETITFSWTGTNATYAAFVPDTSGKDNLQVPGDKLAASGSQPIVANVGGNPYVTLAVYSADGQKATCTKTVSVTYPSTCPSITYQQPICSKGYHVEGTKDSNGCNTGPICVADTVTPTAPTAWDMQISCTTESAYAQRLGVVLANGTEKLYDPSSSSAQWNERVSAQPVGVRSYHAAGSWIANTDRVTSTTSGFHIASEDSTDNDYNDIVCSVNVSGVVAAAPARTNLANALTALEEALKGLLGMLNR